MKTITYYEACDGRRFDDYHECEIYEQNVLKCRLRLCEVEFWDKDKNNMIHPLFTDPHYEFKMDELFANCEYLHICKDIAPEIKIYMNQIWGWIIPYEQGIYKYDWANMKWIRET